MERKSAYLQFCVWLFIGFAYAPPISKAIHLDRDPRCNENEVYTKCRTCEASCENPLPDCPLVCQSEGCECQHSKGFVRHYGHCVPMHVCDSLNHTQISPLTCATVECPALHVCKMKEVACLTKECYPKPECLGLLDVVFPD